LRRGDVVRGSRRWPRIAIGAGALLAVAALVPEPAVRPFVERAVDRHGSDCVELTGFRVVDAGRWPVVLRAAAGKLQDVAVEADEVSFDGGFAIHDVRFRADEIGVAPLRFGTDGGDAVVRGGRSSATLRFDGLERALADLGVDATLRWDGERLVADVQVPFLGIVPTTVDGHEAGGDLELAFAPLDLITLPPLRIDFADPFAFDGLGRPLDTPTRDAVRIDATVDGTLPSTTWACTPA
jgi:hypothetical protein